MTGGWNEFPPKPTTPSVSGSASYYGVDARNRIAMCRFEMNRYDMPPQLQSYWTNNYGNNGLPEVADSLVRYGYTNKFYFDMVLNAASPKYLDVPYDPYPVVRWEVRNDYVTKSETFDLKSQLGEEKYQILWDAYQLVPRSKFEEMATEIIMSIDYNMRNANQGFSTKQIIDKVGFKKIYMSNMMNFMMASQLIDIFNRSNLDKITNLGVTAKFWEESKFRSLATQDVDKKMNELLFNIYSGQSELMTGTLVNDYKRMLFERRVIALPVTGDPAINIQRGVTLGALIEMQEWNMLEMLCSIYEKIPAKAIAFTPQESFEKV